MQDQQLPFNEPTPVRRLMVQKCDHCGAKMVEYRHSLSKSLVRALFKFWNVAGLEPLNLKEADLTRNQWDNFQKLRYFGLVEQCEPVKSGIWQVARRGEQFIFGEIGVPKTAITYRGEVVETCGDIQTFREVTGYYYTREQYARNARPHVLDPTDGAMP